MESLSINSKKKLNFNKNNIEKNTKSLQIYIKFKVKSIN